MVSVSTLLILTALYVLEADSANCPCFSANDADIQKCNVDTSVCPGNECWLYEWQATYGRADPLYPNFALHCSDRVSAAGLQCGAVSGDQWHAGKRYLVQKGGSGNAFCKVHTYKCNGDISSTTQTQDISPSEHKKCAQILINQAFNTMSCRCGTATNGYFRQSNCPSNINEALNSEFCYDNSAHVCPPAGSPALENDEDIDMNEYEIKVASAQQSNTTISMSIGSFIGIIFGVIILSIMFTVFVVWMYRKNKMNKYDLAAVKEEEEDEDEEEQDETTKITEN